MPEDFVIYGRMITSSCFDVVLVCWRRLNRKPGESLHWIVCVSAVIWVIMRSIQDSWWIVLKELHWGEWSVSALIECVIEVNRVRIRGLKMFPFLLLVLRYRRTQVLSVILINCNAPAYCTVQWVESRFIIIPVEKEIEYLEIMSSLSNRGEQGRALLEQSTPFRQNVIDDSLGCKTEIFWKAWVAVLAAVRSLVTEDSPTFTLEE